MERDRQAPETALTSLATRSSEWNRLLLGKKGNYFPIARAQAAQLPSLYHINIPFSILEPTIFHPSLTAASTSATVPG